MECFINENGAERKAELEDLFPLIKEGAAFQFYLREAYNSKVYLAAALAHLPKEMKEMAYRNLSARTGGSLKEWVDSLESRKNKNDYSFLLDSRIRLIDLIGKLEKEGKWGSVFTVPVIWKETETEEEKEAKPSTPLGVFIKRIEKAFDSGELWIAYYTNEISREDIEKAFQDRLDGLHKIRRLEINAKDLPAAALLFETAKIEKLGITVDIRIEDETCSNDIEWPPFLEKCDTLTELALYFSKETEVPSWIRSAPSLRDLSVFGSKNASLQDWLGNMQSLIKLSLFHNDKLESLPDSIGNLENLVELEINGSSIKTLPDSIGNLKKLQKMNICNNPLMERIPDWIGVANKLALESLTELSLWRNENLKIVPDSIGNLKNLVRLDLGYSSVKKIPAGIGGLQSLSVLTLQHNKDLEELPDTIGDLMNLTTLSIDGSSIKTLPDSMGNLKNLHSFFLKESPIERIPDWIGNLQSLNGLLLSGNRNLKTLPDSIGNLKNLVFLDVSNSPMEKLPDTIVNCTALKSVDIFGTKIASVPDFISTVERFNDNTIIDIIPTPTGEQGRSISYKCFCNSYYRLSETILRFQTKARREGLLAMEEDIEHLTEGFFTDGIRLVVDGTDGEIIADILRIRMEREHDFYRKKLMEVAMQGILCIQAGDPAPTIVFLLASLVDIKNNPLEAACLKYLAGDDKASIDFKAAIEPEEEREELRFMKRAMDLSLVARKGGFLALQECLDQEGIARRDVFEYGLALVVNDWDAGVIRKILDNLVEHEVNPVRKNLAQAKEEALLSINAGDNPKVLRLKLCAYFDEDLAAEIRSYYARITNETVS